MPPNREWTLSPYIVILYYPTYACGKFLSNILSFNKNFIPQISLTINRSRSYHPMIEEYSEDMLEIYKFHQIFRSLPPKDDCKEWTNYELGCNQFWGFMSSNLTMLDSVHNTCLKILDSKKYCFIVSHDYSTCVECQKTFPNAKVIELTNYQNVVKKSVALKTNCSEPILKMPDSLSFDHSIKFDIGSMFDKDIFFQNIQKLLSDFNVVDTTLDQRVDQFYQQYIELYE